MTHYARSCHVLHMAISLLHHASQPASQPHLSQHAESECTAITHCRKQEADFQGARFEEARLQAAGFDELEHYYRPPGLPREQQPWLASVWRRQG